MCQHVAVACNSQGCAENFFVVVPSISSIFTFCFRLIMDNYMKSGYIYCCMGPHRLTKKYQIGNPHFHPYFKKFVGEAAVYSAQAYVCKACHSKVMKLKKHEVLPTPGTRNYAVKDKQYGIPVVALNARRLQKKESERPLAQNTDFENRQHPSSPHDPKHYLR